MSIILGKTLVNYKTISSNYIITYITKYNINLDDLLQEIIYKISAYYPNHLVHSNVCGKNAEYICNNLISSMKFMKNKVREVTTGKIIITKWLKLDDDVKKNIELVYGEIGTTIGSSFHALAYLTFYFERTQYHVAIETTLCIPYKLQFYVGSSADELNEIIKARYQCEEFKISYECHKYWMDIRDNKGGKNEKTKKQKKQKKQKKRKNEKTKNEKTKKRKRAFYTSEDLKPHPYGVPWFKL
uniref:Uncharacterized protein n=1 Tax=viral metagenome TaxID=1070528 RepID=A0A6C0EAV5_9ZZZZ